jgi:signal transduction histidine kinase
MRFRDANAELIHPVDPATPGRGVERGATDVAWPIAAATRTRPRSTWGWRWLIPVAATGACAALFVGSDVLEHHLLPSVSTGWRHALLTARSALVAGIGCGVVYRLMVSHQRRINATADDLARRLEGYLDQSSKPLDFHNPHLARSRRALRVEHVDCPMHDRSDRPCWRDVALASASHNGNDDRGGNGEINGRITIQQCHECAVYRLSCPDGLTRLGESFNSLMYMLDEEAQRVRRMQSQMVEKEKMVAIGQMAAGVAHEIANPLSSISSIVQLLKRGPAKNLADNLDLIQTHIERITSTVRQMTSLSRPLPARWRPVDIARTLDEAVRLVSFDRRAESVRIETVIDDALPTTYGLNEQLQQVFINLLLNALDAMADGGRLTVDARCERNHIALTFEDTGCGIPASVGRRIFEPFFTTKDPGKGTGMGLAVSYNIVQKHGGRIEFHDRQGGGTVFTIELPILRTPPDE